LTLRASENAPSIVFIDEIDSLTSKRSDEDSESVKRIKSEFLIQMTKISERNDVLVLAATNRPYDIDPAVRRRFDKRIYIPLPDYLARRKLFQVNLGNNEPLSKDSKIIDEFAQLTDGFFSFINYL
jgi:vacuolar protein-sorting-associated protein 4